MKNRKFSLGFTLVELLVAMVLSVIVLGAGLQTYGFFSKQASSQEKQMIQLQDNLFAMSYLMTDFNRAHPTFNFLQSRQAAVSNFYSYKPDSVDLSGSDFARMSLRSERDLFLVLTMDFDVGQAKQLAIRRVYDSRKTAGWGAEVFSNAKLMAELRSTYPGVSLNNRLFMLSTYTSFSGSSDPARPSQILFKVTERDASTYSFTVLGPSDPLFSVTRGIRPYTLAQHHPMDSSLSWSSIDTFFKSIPYATGGGVVRLAPVRFVAYSLKPEPKNKNLPQTYELLRTDFFERRQFGLANSLENVDFVRSSESIPSIKVELKFSNTR